jgi:hypothetical protein
MFPGLNSDGRDGTLFGQRVSAEFVMVLIAKLGGRVEVNMWQELDALHAAGVQIIAQPKSNIAGPDVYRLIDRNGQPWPPAAPEPAPADTPQLEEGVIEGEIVEDDERGEAMQWRDIVTLDVLDQEENRQDPQGGNHEVSQ